MKRFLALALAFVLAVSAFGCKQSDPAVGGDSTTTPSGTSGTNPTDATDPNEETPKEGVYLRDKYSVTDDEALAQTDAVVGTVGDQTMTNGLLQMFYWNGVYSFLNEYGAYIYYYGLDTTKSLSEQAVSGGEGTWQQYFLDEAFNVWHQYQVLTMKNDELELEMDPDLQKELDETEQLMLDSAEEGKYESVDAMLIANMGKGATMENYMKYTELFYRSYNYYLHIYNGVEVTDQQIEDYFTENQADLEESGLTKETMQYDVRHILIVPEGGTTDDSGNTTYSDAEYEACKEKAQSLLNQWLSGDATEESFAELAKEHSEDPGSAENGGMYEGLTEQTSFVEEFKSWYLDENRKVGDYGLVKSSYGYHIMYFSASDVMWQDYCREMIINEEISEIITGAMEEYPMEIHTDRIALAEVKLSSSEEEAS